MARSAALRLADLRAVQALAGECRDLGDDPVLWRRHLLAGVGRLAGAGLACLYEGTWEPFRPAGVADWGWQNGFDRPVWDRMNAAFARHGLGYNPMFRPYTAALGRGLGPALTRADVVRAADWYRSPYYREYHAPGGGDAMLYCNVRLPSEPERLSGLVLLRPVGELDYAPRVRTVVAELHRAVAPLVGGPLARLEEPSPAALSPLARRVLRCLLEGDSDKQAAARLGLTRHTVNQYAKVIHRHFGVHSRAELLARWVRRGWAVGGWADDPPVTPA